VSAQSSVTVYGLVDVGIEANSAGKGTNWREITGGSLGSRLGFRGVEDLGNGLSAVFRLEQGFSPDDGTLQQGGRMFGREASVGLSSKSAGTLSAGRIPTPLYNVAAYVDAFGWMGGGLVALTRSAAATTQVLPLLLNARSDNSVAYLSPKLGGLEVRAQGALGEGGTTLGRAYGFSGRYTGGALDLVAGYGRQNAGTTGTGKLKSYVVGGSFDFGAAKLFAGVSDDVNSCSNCTGALARPVGITATGDSETRLYNLGVRLPFGSTTAIVQYAHVDDRSEYLVNPGDRDANWVALGAEYALSKRTLIYSSISTINNKNGSQYNLGTSAAGQQPAATTLASNNARAKTAAIGVRHNF
jgi:predicted porin